MATDIFTDYWLLQAVSLLSHICYDSNKVR